MSEPQRLFFAIDLPAEIREQIIHWRATHFPPDAGRPVAADNLHLTLAFLGEVSAEKEKALSLAGRIRQLVSHSRLMTPGQWLRSRVVWLDASAATRLNPAGEYAPFTGCPQRLFSKQSSVSSTYYLIARRQRGGDNPAARF